MSVYTAPELHKVAAPPARALAVERIIKGLTLGSTDPVPPRRPPEPGPPPMIMPAAKVWAPGEQYELRPYRMPSQPTRKAIEAATPTPTVIGGISVPFAQRPEDTPVVTNFTWNHSHKGPSCFKKITSKSYSSVGEFPSTAPDLHPTVRSHVSVNSAFESTGKKISGPRAILMPNDSANPRLMKHTHRHKPL